MCAYTTIKIKGLMPYVIVDKAEINIIIRADKQISECKSNSF